MRTLAHIGIPVKEKPAKSTYLPGLKLYITDPSDTKNNLEFLFFEAGCQMPDIVKNSTHIAYMVDNLESEIKDSKILIQPFLPLPGVKAAFIEEDGIPIELMQAI